MNAGTEGIAGFRDFIASLGFEPPDRIEPGQFVRFSANGKRSNSSASAKLFPDLEGGIVWNWATGDEWLWQAKREAPRSEQEQRAYRERCEKAKRDAAALRETELRETAERAERIWRDAQPADDAHGYLTAKGVRSHGLRVYKGALALSGMRCEGALIAPRRTAGGDLVSLQFIAPNGEKRYLNGPVPAGAYFSIGKPEGVLCIAEGYATAASIHEATGYAVAVTFDAANLEPTARALRAKFPDMRLILCADDDWKVTRNGEPYNPGIDHANAAAVAVAGLVAIPDFGADRPEGATDFNDLHKLRGVAAVRKALEAAQAPGQVSAPQPRPANRSTAVLAGQPPEPKLIPDGLLPVKAFDFELLPESVRPWARDICERMQCPPDFVGVSVMAALGAVIGRQVVIRPQAKTDWSETANLWAMLIGRPGLMKSPATEQATAPVRRLQAEAADRYDLERDEYERKLREVKLRQEAGQQEARKKLKSSMAANITDELSIPEPEEPRAKRYIVNDSTYEAIGETHKGNPNGVLVYRDELVSLLQALDREDNAAARSFYLSGWSGKQSYDFDRITRKGARLDAVCLSILGSTQPGRIQSYVRMAVKGGAGDDGLLQRFGLMVWPDVSASWKAIDREPDYEARNAAFAAFKRLDAIDTIAIDAKQDHDANGELEGPPYLRPNAAALALFGEWHEALELRLRGASEEPALESHFSKYRKLIPSLALVLHLASGRPGPVNADAMLRALAWGEYLESHARRVYASITGPVSAAAKAIIERIRKGEWARDDAGNLTPFRARKLYRTGWAHLSDRDTVLEALELLVDLDWLSTQVCADPDGGRPTTEYVPNPRAFR